MRYTLNICPGSGVRLLSMLLLLSYGCVVMSETREYKLPKPRLENGASLVEALSGRRSVREFSSQALTIDEITQLLWAAQGITSRGGYRTTPSAGALYPLELHLVAGEVAGLPPGSYRYNPVRHVLEDGVSGDLRPALARTALNQTWISQAPAVVVISAVYSRTSWKYGKRAIRYVHIEAGNASQNLLLQATALGLGSVVVGAFDDEALSHLLNLPASEKPLLILPIGHKL